MSHVIVLLSGPIAAGKTTLCDELFGLSQFGRLGGAGSDRPVRVKVARDLATARFGLRGRWELAARRLTSLLIRGQHQRHQPV